MEKAIEKEKQIKLSGSNRAFELDAIRGFSIFMMILHHTAYDLRYIFEYNLFSFISGDCRWFWGLLQPFFLCLFVGVSGICCQFSRNNFKRAFKLGLVAIAFSAATITADHFFDLECSVYFNVLHVLTVATLLFAVFDHFERKKTGERQSRGGTFILLIVVLLAVFLSNAIPEYNEVYKNGWVFILGIEPHPSYDFVMGDEMGLFPWLGVFFLGVLIGRLVYSNKETVFPNTPRKVRAVLKPFEWIGRHSLLIYILHQPVVLGILYGLRAIGVLP